MLRTLLRLVADGKTGSLSGTARSLAVSEEALGGMIERLAALGYLEEIRGGGCGACGGCSGCAMAGACGGGSSGGNRSRFWAVTARGRRAAEEGREDSPGGSPRI